MLQLREAKMALLGNIYCSPHLEANLEVVVDNKLQIFKVCPLDYFASQCYLDVEKLSVV